MINEHYLNMLSNKSVIRTLSEYATARGKEVGYENVFDFSLGNPSVPAPQSFKDVSISLLETMEPLKLHGYSPTLGIPEVKEKVAASLNRRFGMNYTGNHIFATSGAAGALAHALRAVTKPGDEVLVFAPYFPEYNPYINDTGARIKVVPADLETFQINFAEAEKYLTENVAAVLINTPNNPSGVLYSEETLEKLADLLTRKSAEFVPYFRRALQGDHLRRQKSAVCGEVLSPHADLLFILQVPLRARRAYRLCGSKPCLRARRGPGPHVRTDLQRNRPQLPVLPDHAGYGGDSGRHGGPLRL